MDAHHLSNIFLAFNFEILLFLAKNDEMKNDRDPRWSQDAQSLKDGMNRRATEISGIVKVRDQMLIDPRSL